VKAAFTDIDVVISTVGTEAISKQYELADAAKAANVKLFVPSEFGDPSEIPTVGFWVDKRKFQVRLEEIKLPYVLVYNGIWPDYFFCDP
jgi:hypothetical protein